MSADYWDEEKENFLAEVKRLQDLEQARVNANERAERWKSRAEAAERRAELAENERDVLGDNHKQMAKQLADLARERDEAAERMRERCVLFLQDNDEHCLAAAIRSLPAQEGE